MKSSLSVVWLLLFMVIAVIDLRAQCNFSIVNLPDTLVLCKNQSIALNPSVLSTGAAPTYLDTFWTPGVGLSDSTLINPIVTVGTTSASYILTIQGVTPTNLITNGDFSLGNTVFSSSYIYGTGGAYGLLSYEGQYAIATNPNSTHVNFASFGDHTTGTGNMMVVNGAGTANVNIWCQTISVLPNTWYDFSAWGATCVASNPAILQFSINGSLIGSALSLPLTTGVWTPFHATWFSGSNTSISICITDQSTATSGNDFAIDDISFRQICSVSDSVYVNVVNLTPAIASTVYPGCSQDSVQFQSLNGVGTIPTSYAWDFGDFTTSTLANPLHIYSAQSTYPVKLVVEAKGCKDSAYTTIDIHHPMQASFSIPDSACVGQLITASDFSSATGPYTSVWDWQDGPMGADAFHTYASTGSYTVSVTVTDVLGCQDEDSHVIAVKTAPYLTLPKDIEWCEGEPYTIEANSNGSVIIWQDGSTGPQYTTSSSGIFYASTANFCGLASDTMQLFPRNCNCRVDVPTGFTPNGDNLNETFKPLFSNCEISNYDLMIFNRWGKMIWHSSNTTEAWDGRFMGVEQETGVYFYLLQYFSMYEGIHYLKGDVTLFR